MQLEWNSHLRIGVLHQPVTMHTGPYHSTHPDAMADVCAGIPERLLIMEIGLISPSHARELLSLLVDGGRLRTQSSPSVCATAKKTSVLAACFGMRNGRPDDRCCRFYFPSLATNLR